ncbi:hypothetical protein RI543_003226 [Arxiozyma heterogenica]|uniref:Uncharacterized protein n=1 Tax=Arxiozyma heterogenica TaxID=278026 RepID=A0AAN8A7X9_9SACH|nr:hypothetical protein RI543_003226 [Kazachstania heterogenica]
MGTITTTTTTNNNNNNNNNNNGSSGPIDNIPRSVIDWLQQNIYKLYKIDPRTTFNDSLLALSLFKQNLRPRTRVFTDSRGKSHLLLCFYGKFKIVSRIKNNSSIGNDNGIYADEELEEIPVLIWIEEDYPLSHPLCYLDLEQIDKDWVINIGKNIDSNGQIYLPFFKDWNDQDSNYNIINTIKNLQNTINNEVLLRRKQPLLPPKVRDIDISNVITATAIATTIIPPAIPERPKLPTTTTAGSILQTDIKPEEEKIVDLMDTDIISTDLLSRSNVENSTTHQQQIDELSDLLNKLEIMEEERIKQVEDIKLNEIDESIRQFQETLDYENKEMDKMKSQIGMTRDLVINKIKGLEEIELNWSERYRKINDVLLSDKDNDEEYNFQTTETLGLNQLYGLVAEDMALDDTISVLNGLLSKKGITVDIFIRKTRDLAKRQFMIRLHIEKIYNMLNESA